MKFFKGMILGTIVSTGVIMMMSDNKNTQMIKKKSRKMMRNIEKMF